MDSCLLFRSNTQYAVSTPIPGRRFRKFGTILRCSTRGEKTGWSKGDAPGQYGGPPLDFKIRKLWGSDTNDPITSQDTYIWNADWQKTLDSEKNKSIKVDEGVKTEEEEGGFLSMGRVFALDSMDVDLSVEINRIKGSPSLQNQVEHARNLSSLKAKNDEIENTEKIKWKSFPSKSQQKTWDKQSKQKVYGIISDQSSLSPAEIIEQERNRFYKLQFDLQVYTLLLGACGLSTAYFTYTPEITFSFGAGMIGAIAYIRMLSSSVESLGKQNIQGAVKGALGQPRLLVPVILVMLLNRWNAIVVPEYGLTELQLIPMLVGFFTYKGATLAVSFRDIILPLVPQEEEKREDVSNRTLNG